MPDVKSDSPQANLKHGQAIDSIFAAEFAQLG